MASYQETDPRNADYTMEHGATRSFQTCSLTELRTTSECAEEYHNDPTNPIKALERRTQASLYEMEKVERLEKLRALNDRHVAFHQNSLIAKQLYITRLTHQPDLDEDENLVNELFGLKQHSGGTREEIDSFVSSYRVRHRHIAQSFIEVICITLLKAWIRLLELNLHSILERLLPRLKLCKRITW